MSRSWLHIMLLSLTDGRPMIGRGFAFKDRVTGLSVHYYEDRLGRWWLADNGPWSLFRVKPDSTTGGQG